MTDIYSREKRSEIMAAIRPVDTQPELMIRRALHRRGFRYRLHAYDLPGRPDVVLRKYGAVIQIRGCFWHGHSCPRGKLPKNNLAYWGSKLDQTRARDAKNDDLLRNKGWRVFMIWECALKNEKGLNTLADRLSTDLRS